MEKGEPHAGVWGKVLLLAGSNGSMHQWCPALAVSAVYMLCVEGVCGWCV